MMENILRMIGKDVVIERKTVIEGDCSGDTVIWTTLATVTGAIKTLNGNEIKIAEKLGVDAQYKLYCEKIAITELDRVKFEGKHYKITFIENPMSMDRFLQVYLKRDDSYVNNSNQ